MTAPLFRTGAEPHPAPSFLPLRENRFAVTALLRLRNGNPQPPIVFLYGSSGVGKSLLLRWFRKDMTGDGVAKRFAQMTAATFVESTIHAVNQRRVDELQDELARSNFFICEDLPAIHRHAHAQQVLETVIDEVVAGGGRVVLTGPAMPAELGAMSQRLVSRCHAAACVEIPLPGVESRCELISHFAQQCQLTITAKSVRLLAETMSVSPRELFSAVRQLQAFSNLANTGVIGSTQIRDFLKGQVRQPAISLAEISRTVARFFGLTKPKLWSPSRVRSRVIARQIAMYLARALTGRTLDEIAGYFGRKNHSTVVHAYQRISALLTNDPAVHADVRSICAALGVPLTLSVDNSSTTG